MGRVLPTDLERMTIDQVLIMWLSSESLGTGPTKISVDEAIAQGCEFEHSGKSAAEMAWEAEAAKQAAEKAAQEAAKQSEQPRRRRRRRDKTKA